MITTPFFPIKQAVSPSASNPGNPSTHEGPLDPEVVYRQTRPSDWLKMPDVSETPGNLYALVLIPQGAVAYFPLNISGSEVKIEYGYTDSNGSFITTEVASAAAIGRFDGMIDSSDFSNITSDGHVQCMVRISYQEGAPFILFTRPLGDSEFSWVSPIREISCNVCGISFGGFYPALKQMKYFYGIGFSAPFSMFKDNISLIAVRRLEMRNFNDASYYFCGCSSLIAIPQIDFSHIYEFSGVFKDCISLEYLPELNTVQADRVEEMFAGCISLKELPLMDTSEVNVFTSFLKDCISIKEIGFLDTSSGTDFDEMFSGCIGLRKIPAIDTTRAYSMTNMFKSCSALTTVPALHTERLSNLNLFYDSAITSLINLPVSETTQAISFENMHALCRVTLACDGWEGCDISFLGTFLSRDAYVEFFQSLPETTGVYTITIGNVLGNSGLSDEDKYIARNKGWTVL